MRTPTDRERDWILDRVRRQLNCATGARPCHCATKGPASKGFRLRWDPRCPDCRNGLIPNSGWDGTGEQFDRLLPTLKGWMSGGTAIIEPTDGVGPGRDCANYNTTPKGISLTRGYDFDSGTHADVTRMTWTQIRRALLEPADSQLTLEIPVSA